MKCPYCQEEINENDRFCPHCDGYIKPSTKGKPAQATKQCFYCRRSMPKSSTYCPNCGKSTKANDPFAQFYNTPPQPVQPVQRTNGFAIAGFVLSLLFPLLGLIFSCIGRSKSYETNSGGGLATAGIVISIVFLAISFINCVQICNLVSAIETSSY